MDLVGRIVRIASLVFVAACASPASRVEAHAPPTSPIVVVTPRRDLACERAPLPSVHGTIVLPDALVSQAMAPVLRAVCACTRPGQRVRLVATLTPSLGAAVVETPGDDLAGACLEHLAIDAYEPFDVGSDCIDCGPRRFGVFHGSNPPPPPATKIVLAFELLR